MAKRPILAFFPGKIVQLKVLKTMAALRFEVIQTWVWILALPLIISMAFDTLLQFPQLQFSLRAMSRAGTMQSGPSLWPALQHVLDLILSSSWPQEAEIIWLPFFGQLQCWTEIMYVISPDLAFIVFEIDPYHIQKSLYWFNDSIPASSKVLRFFWVSIIVVHFRMTHFI